MPKQQKRINKRRRGNKAKKQLVATVNHSPNFMPTRLRTILKFNESFILNNAGMAYGNKRLQPTYCYDVDPTLGSTAMPGFTELMLLYRYYRMRRFHTKIQFVSREAFPTQGWVCPSNGDPGVNTSSYQNYISNRRGKTVVLGQNSGNSKGIITLPWIGIDEFGGSMNSLVPDSYASSGVTAPVNNIYIGYGVSTDGTVLAGGVYVSISLDIEIDFFELASPAS